MVVVRRALVILVAGTLGYSGATWGQALSSSDPPGRVGRLAFVEGTVSYHDADRTDWQPAMVNHPMTNGDALWTEPSAHAEISIAGTRVRMDGASQLGVVAIDDRLTRLQLDQGRVDIKTFTYDARQPYEIVTPRGVASLQQQGDYYIESGSTQDPTRFGVRQGAGQFQAPDGRILAVRAGEVAEITGDGSTMELHTIKAPPPPMPQYWAARDRVVVYDRPPQYLSAGITGYEDLNYYGTWNNDPEYGQVWYVRDAPAGWAPYTTGRWTYQPVYGWTWVDEQPWGFAPYHYGRWAQRNNRWFWVPPERSQPAVYAPALVAFVGGTELGMALGAQSRQPVGWFPLGPREVYVPPYTANRDYYRRLNLSARVQDRILDDRWMRVQRREAIPEQNWMNRRFATVVPSEAFARSQPVQRAALRVEQQRLATVPVAPIATPPSPTVSVRALQGPAATAPDRARPGEPQRPGEPGIGARGPANVTATAPAAAMLQAIKPEPEQRKAPGPEVTARTATAAPSPDQKAPLPQLAPRNASAPPPPQIQGDRQPASTQPSGQQATAPANQPATAPRPGEPAKPGEPQATAPTRQGEPPRPGDANRAQPGQANLPPVRDRNEQRPEPPKPGQPQANTTPNAQAPKPGEPPKPPQAQGAPAQQQTTPQQRPAESPKPPQASNTPQRQAEPPKPGEQPRPPQAQSAPAQQQATPQQRPAEPPKPPQASNAPQRQAEPPRQPQQATPPAPPPQQNQQQLQRQPSAPPPSQTHAAPPPSPPQQQPQRQAAPPPQQHQQQQAAPQPQPQPQPQRQASPPPQQHQQAAPQPRPQAPQQQAQTPQPQPQQQQAKPQPQQHQGGGQQKQDDKK